MREMPFGKFKGVPLAELPDDYLTWLLSLGDGLREPLKTAVMNEWQSRQRPRGAVKALPEPIVSAAQEIVAIGSWRSNDIPTRAEMGER